MEQVFFSSPVRLIWPFFFSRKKLSEASYKLHNRKMMFHFFGVADEELVARGNAVWYIHHTLYIYTLLGFLPLPYEHTLFWYNIPGPSKIPWKTNKKHQPFWLGFLCFFCSMDFWPCDLHTNWPPGPRMPVACWEGETHPIHIWAVTKKPGCLGYIGDYTSQLYMGGS